MPKHPSSPRSQLPLVTCFTFSKCEQQERYSDPYGNQSSAQQPRKLWQRGITSIFVITLFSSLLCPSIATAKAKMAPLAQSSSDPLVLAFYYTWFDENTWNYDQLSDLPAEPYVSRDRGVMGRHIDQAKAAGIDAFLVAWYGPGENQTEPNLAALLEEAAARNFKIGIMFETTSPFLGGTGAITGALQHALSVHANQPAFLRVDGRPVIFFWRPTIYGVDSWRAIRSQADPGYGSVWVAEGVDTSYLAVFDGHHLYSNTWNPPADLAFTNQKFADRVNSARQSYGAYKFWVATVMPGYNDVRIRPGSGFAKDREGGAYYERAWQAAIGSRPDWIIITSFNEWPEGSYIEPSAAFGNQYLNLTAAWSGQFKGRGQQVQGQPLPVVAAAAPAEPVPTATPEPEPDVPTAFVTTALLNLRAGPGSDGYAIVGQAFERNALAITGKNGEPPSWWQISNGETTAWVSADFVRAAGPLADVPLVALPTTVPAATPAPIATVTATATVTAPLNNPDLLAAAALTTPLTTTATVTDTTNSNVVAAKQPLAADTTAPLPPPVATGRPTYKPFLSREP